MDLTIKEYNKIKKKYINIYQDKILDLRKEYEKNIKKISIKKFNNLNKLYREYIEQLIIDLTREFRKIYNIDFCVTLSGSLGRNSNDLYSDIDINYLIDSRNYVKLIKIEDKINYILQDVLKFRGKDRIHSMVVYLPLINDKKIRAIKENEYQLKFIDGYINVPCRDNSFQLMYETYNSTRNINDVIKYFNNHDTVNELNEWTYCFKFLDSPKYQIYYNHKRKEFRKNINIDSLKKKIIEEINNNSIYLDNNITCISNSKLKSIYKTKVFFDFYKLLALYYRLEPKVFEFTLTNFEKNSEKLNKKIINKFYKHQNIIQTLQLILDKQDLDLSSHSNEILDLKFINKEYYKLTNKKNIIKVLNKSKKELYKECIKNLEGIRYE